MPFVTVEVLNMNVPIERMPYAAHELYVFPWFPHLGRVMFALLSEVYDYRPFMNETCKGEYVVWRE